MAKMGRYIAGRLVQSLVTLIIVTSIIFVLFEAMPGDPLDKFRANPATTAADLERLGTEFGLTKSVPMPGDYFTGTYVASEVGMYQVDVTVTDKNNGNTETASTYFEIVMDPEGDHEPPSISDITVWQNSNGTAAAVNATITDEATITNASAYISGHNFTAFALMKPLGNDLYSALLNNMSFGTYNVSLVALDSRDNNATAAISFDEYSVGTAIWGMELSEHVIDVSQNATVTAEIVNPLSPPIVRLVSPLGVSEDIPMVHGIGTVYTADITAAEQGDYSVWVSAGGEFDAYQRLSVNTLSTAWPSPVSSSDGTVTNLVIEYPVGVSGDYPIAIKNNEIVSSQNVKVVINVTAAPHADFTVSVNITKPGGNHDVLEATHPNKSVRSHVYERYFAFMKNMFTFNFGDSYSKGAPVIDLINQKAPRTLALFGTGAILSYIFGVAIGSYIAWRRGGIAEGSIITGSLFFYNMPTFWIGLIMIWVFAYYWKLFPLGGFTGMDETIVFFGLTGAESYAGILDFLWHMALPLFVEVLIGVAGVILLMRTSLLEVMREDYILTAKAKGLTERKVRIKHANRNAYLPIVTSLTLTMAGVLGGAVIFEQVFSYPGMGLLYLEALYNQDHFLSGAILFILSLMVIVANIVADLLYGFLDPRVRV